MKVNNNVKDFGTRLKNALKRKNMSQSKLSEISGINTSTISEYISGKYEPSRTRIAEFANILNVNEVWLMGYDVPMEANIIKNLSLKKATEIPVILESSTELLKIQKWFIDKTKNMDDDKARKLKSIINPIMDLILKN